MSKYFKSNFLKFAMFFVITILLSTTKAYAIDSASTTQDLQSKINAAMLSRQTSYSLNYTGNIPTFQTDITTAINNIYTGDDYLHYTNKGYSYSYIVSAGVASVNFTFNYWNTAAMDSYVNTKVTEVLGEIITSGMTDFEKEKAIHDWIAVNVAYDSTLVKHSDYDGLVSPFKTVCQGYALLSYKMLNQAGVETKIIEGLGNGQAHAWNLVKIDGAWYHFDATWDDPLPDVAGRVTYGYYNLTDTQIKALKHSWTKVYPAANTDFGTTLNTKLTSDPTNATTYESLIDALDLELLAPENTASNASELNAEIQEAITNNQTSIKVRYLSGSTLVTDLTTAIQAISNISSYSYYKTDYYRSSVTGDVLLNLTINYSTPVSAASITLNASELNLGTGALSTLTPTVLPSTASNKTVVWSTSNSSVATVSNGIVNAIGGGTATITARTSDGNFTATATVNVTQGVSGIIVSASDPYVKVGGADKTLTATVNPSGATNKNVTWKTSNPSVATVDSTGKVHAVAYGSAIITATSVENPLKIGKYTVIVPVPITSVTVTSTSNYVKMGSSLTLGKVFTPSTATIKTVTWTSSNEAVAKVSSTGVVTGVTPGTVTITATSADGQFTSTKDLTVVYGVTSITLDKTYAYERLGGDDLSLTPTVNPSNATNKSLVWKSSNPAIATVDSTGTVHAVAYGSVTLTATSVQDPTKVGKCTVVVPVPVTGVTVTSTSNYVKMGSSLTLGKVFTPSTATIKTVTWSSSNQAVAKVSSTGVVTPVTPGTVTITATSTDGEFTSTKDLTIVYGVTSVALNQTTMTRTVGSSDITLLATINPTNASNKSLVWKSSNTNIATVDSTGKIHVIAPGKVVISATSVQDPAKIGKCTITVTN